MSLTGTLHDFTTAEVMQIIALGKKSGVLAITSEDEEARAFFDSGKAVHAVCGESVGEDAVFAMLGFAEGYFEFEQLEVDCETTITDGVESLILEAMRRTDEQNASETRQEKPAMRFLLSAPPLLQRVGAAESHEGSIFGDDYRTG